MLVQFDRAHAGCPPDAIWLIDSPENRQWIHKHAQSIDINSAIFDEDADPLTVVWNVIDHHPDWSTIVVRGASLTPEMERAVAGDAVIANRSNDEVRLRRP